MMTLRNLLFVVLLVLVGCHRSGTSVTGTVSYDGQPVPRGVITLTPTDGSGKPEGSKILAGKFEITSIEPGQKRVSVIGVTAEPSSTDEPVASDDKIKNMVEASRSAEMIPTNAKGNGQTVSIAEGQQEIIVELSHPSSSP